MERCDNFPVPGFWGLQVSILSLLQTQPTPWALTSAPGHEPQTSRAQDTAAKDPQPFSSGPPPSPVDNVRKWTAIATPAQDNKAAEEPVEQVLDEETQSALVQANNSERLDMPRMSASLASALITLNAKPSSMSDLLQGEEGPRLVERAYSQLGGPAERASGSFTAYSRSA